MKGIPNGFKMAFYLLGIMWIIYFIDTFLPIDLRNYGIIPRDISSLCGILFAPFIHRDMSHIVANSAALFVLSGITFSYDKFMAIKAMFIIIVISGMCVWLFGGNGVHIGASGLIFGLIGFLLLLGIYRKEPKAIIVSIIVLLAYGGTLLSLLVAQRGISWTGHFFGFCSGTYAASVFKKNKKK